MTTKFVEIKLCKTCNQNLNYKKFRKVKGNLIIVSDIVNRMKQDSTLEDMEKILKYYTKLLKKMFNISNLNNIIKLND